MSNKQKVSLAIVLTVVLSSSGILSARMTGDASQEGTQQQQPQQTQSQGGVKISEASNCPGGVKMSGHISICRHAPRLGVAGICASRGGHWNLSSHATHTNHGNHVTTDPADDCRIRPLVRRGCGRRLENIRGAQLLRRGGGDGADGAIDAGSARGAGDSGGDAARAARCAGGRFGDCGREDRNARESRECVGGGGISRQT